MQSWRSCNTCVSHTGVRICRVDPGCLESSQVLLLMSVNCFECGQNDWRSQKDQLDKADHWYIIQYQEEAYLTMINCCPEWVTIWRKIQSEIAVIIAVVLDKIFLKQRPLEEVLMNNRRISWSNVKQVKC